MAQGSMIFILSDIAYATFY